MRTTIIFGTSQNKVWLAYIFGIFFRLVVELHYGHVALLFFKVGYSNDCSNSKATNTCEDKKKKQVIPVLM